MSKKQTKKISVRSAFRKKNITVEQTQEIYFKHKIYLNRKDAAEILDNMYFLADLFIDQNLKK
ncbi:hypothetical protein [Olivibacter sp. XZL3]|uniref:hypothetical protein n=1 Tax=Olivibacter sp. XZL3 TaxID=1735116 RepID=UPI00106688BF|nr:hypothetical protein [Olivibacter sp. XZL3]